MTEHSVSRTLLKSPPELWAELSDAAALGRHLGELGEITITRMEPERAVAWEGERACGTVALEPAGWGTRVTVAATPTVGGESAAGGEAAEEAEKVEDVATAEDLVAAEDLLAAEEPAVPADQPWGDHPAWPLAAMAEPAAEPLPLTEAPEAPRALPVDAERLAAPPRRWRMLSRLLSWRRAAPGAAPAPVSEPAAEPEPELPPGAQPEPDATPEPSAVGQADAESVEDREPEVTPELPDGPEPAEASPVVAELELVLRATLDSLGAAHHRPFSRG
jgi:hypothetical protein